jgi:hypothetical protein
MVLPPPPKKFTSAKHCIPAAKAVACHFPVHAIPVHIYIYLWLKYLAPLLCHKYKNSAEPPFNVPQFKVFMHLTFNFYDPKSIISTLNFLSLMFKSTVSKQTLNRDFTACMCMYFTEILLVQDHPKFWLWLLVTFSSSSFHIFVDRMTQTRPQSRSNQSQHLHDRSLHHVLQSLLRTSHPVLCNNIQTKETECHCWKYFT